MPRKKVMTHAAPKKLTGPFTQKSPEAWEQLKDFDRNQVKKSKRDGCVKGFYVVPKDRREFIPGMLCHGAEVCPPCSEFKKCKLIKISRHVKA